MAKLDPQPQDAVAAGLTILNIRPIKSSMKSIFEPRKRSSETESIATVAPNAQNRARRLARQNLGDAPGGVFGEFDGGFRCCFAHIDYLEGGLDKGTGGSACLLLN